jgi:hypothetical protein
MTGAQNICMITTLTGLCLAAGCNVAPPLKPSAQPEQPAQPEPAAQPEPTPQPQPTAVTWKPAPLPGGKMLLMHYMPWYETPAVRGAWGSHWKGPQAQHNPDQRGPDGRPDIWSHYHPLIEPYDSSDPAVLECQLLQMRLAGIQGVVADWYGIGEKADHPAIHHATRALFEATRKFGMKFVACYEDRSLELMVRWNQLAPEHTTNALADTLRWMQQEWFTRPNYLRIQGRPLLLNFGPIYFRSVEAWTAAFADLPQRPLFFGLHHLWRQAGADGGFTWVHYDPWEGNPDDRQIRARIGEVFTYFSSNPREVIVSAFPGFNDVYTHEHHHELAHRDGATMRETLQVAMAGPWPLIQLVTWNDYGEGTMIEPTHEFGYTFLEVIQEERRRELGDGFVFSAEDLRLPAQLFTLRKKGTVPADQLEEIAGLLAAGKCQEARLRLQANHTDVAEAVPPPGTH